MTVTVTGSELSPAKFSNVNELLRFGHYPTDKQGLLAIGDGLSNVNLLFKDPLLGGCLN
jgi:hypothetical protein